MNNVFETWKSVKNLVLSKTATDVLPHGLQELSKRIYVWNIPIHHNLRTVKGKAKVAARITDVADELNRQYPDSYIVFNFSPLRALLQEHCSLGQVVDYSEQSIENFPILLQFCFTAHQWVSASEGHIAIFAFSPERTEDPSYVDFAALLCSCYLMFSGTPCSSGSDVLHFVERDFGLVRSLLQRPSQESYVNYFHLMFEIPVLPNTKRLKLFKISLHNLENMSEQILSVQVETEGRTRTVDQALWTMIRNSPTEVPEAHLQIDMPVFGDFSLVVFKYSVIDDEPAREHLLRYAFSTIFVHQQKHRVKLKDMDYANKNPTISHDFYALLHFGECSAAGASDELYMKQLMCHIEKSPKKEMILARDTKELISEILPRSPISPREKHRKALVVESRRSQPRHCDAQPPPLHNVSSPGAIWKSDRVAFLSDSEATPPLAATRTNSSCSLTTPVGHSPRSSDANNADSLRATLQLVLPPFAPNLKGFLSSNKRQRRAAGSNKTASTANEQFGSEVDNTSVTGSNCGEQDTPTPRVTEPVSISLEAPPLGKAPPPPLGKAPPPPPGKAPPPPPEKVPPPPLEKAPPPLGKAPPPPPPSGKKGAPPPPPGKLSAKGPVKPAYNGPKLKSFFWKKVVRGGGLWDGKEQVHVGSAVDEEFLRFVFEVKKQTAVVPKVKPKNVIGGNVVTGQRLQNIGITLKRLKLKNSEIVRALLNCDSQVLSMEHLDSLQTILPTLVESAGLREETKDHTIQWSASEELLYQLCSEFKDVKERIALWRASVEFNLLISAAEESLCTVERANEVLLSTTSRLSLVLKILLVIGNVMNRGTTHGEAVGYRLENLTSLSFVKSVDGKLSLLEVLVLCVQKFDASLLQFPTDVRVPLKMALGCPIQSTSQQMLVLNHNLQKMKKVVDEGRKMEQASQDPLATLSEACYSKHMAVVSALTLRQQSVKEDVGAMLEFFGEDSATEETVVWSALLAFAADVESCVEKLQRQKKTVEVIILQAKEVAVESTKQSEPDSLTNTQEGVL